MAGVVLILVGLGAWVVAAAVRPSDRAHLLAGNAPVNRGATDDLNLDANNSPRLIANPQDPANLAVVNRVDLPLFGCALNVSFDWGATWMPSRLPAVDEDHRCFAPEASFSADGRLVLTYSTMNAQLVRGASTEGLWVASSVDGGRTFAPPVEVVAPSPGAVPMAFQTDVAADPTVPGRIYLAWVRVMEATSWGIEPGDNPVVVARSDDGGATWSAPVRVSPPVRRLVAAPSLAVAAGGRLYVAYLDLGDDKLDYIGAHDGKGGPAYGGRWTLVDATSDDGGGTWVDIPVDSAVVPADRVIMAFPPRPAVAVHGDGVYIAFSDARLDDTDVWVWASTDAGRHWRAPVRVNDTAPKDGTSQYLPAVSVAPNGRVDVVYYDRRADQDNFLNEVSLQSSSDGGRTFGPRLRLSDRGFDSRIGYNSVQGLPQLGDRLAIRSTDRADIAVWADTRSGIPLTGKQDLARAVVVYASRRNGAEVAWRVAGSIAVGVGAAAVLAGARRKRRGVSALRPPASLHAGAGAE